MPKFTCDVCVAEFGSDERLADHYTGHTKAPASMPS